MADDNIYVLGDQKPEPEEPLSPETAATAKIPSEVLSILKSATNRNASDVHFQVGSYPIFRVDGMLTPFMQAKPVTSAFMAGCADLILSGKQKKLLSENRQLDCSATITGFTHRFRINFFFQQGHLSGSFRINPMVPPTMDQLGLPPLMEKLAALPHGLVLITGATGSGKTTTLAAIVNYMNNHRSSHIITLSDPTEYVHKNNLCLISQREIGSDATSFASALRVALREDPDVIIVEEMRDLETIALALTAAETGHLVFATLHTNDVVQAVDRMIDVFPAHQQAQVRFQMALSLQAVISQVLLRKKSGHGRVAVFETMPVTTPIRSLIRENKMMQVYNVISTSRAHGMILRNDALKEYVQKGLISEEEAATCFMDTSLFENEPTNWRKGSGR